MKKYSIYIVVLIIGFLLGWIFFRDSSAKETMHNHNGVIQDSQKWTCSMHPNILQSEFGSCPICGMDLTKVSTNELGLNENQFKMTKNAIALANIQTLIVGNSNIENNAIALSGEIVTNENNNSVITAHFGGRIEKLYINYKGEEIRQGQLLALVYSPELVTTQRELLTALDMKFTQPELYKAVRNKLKLWKVSEKQIQNIESTREIITNFPVYSESSGIVTEKKVEDGSHVMEGNALFKVSNLNTVWAEFDIYENQIALLKKGQIIKIITNAYPNETFEAKISFIDPVLNSRTRTVNVRTILNNKKKLLKPGMFVQGKIKVVSKKVSNDVINIPSSAVMWTGKRSVIYLKMNSEKPVFEMREIILGNRIGEVYEILEGLKDGDEIVVNGTFTVDAAAQLQGKKSMMNKDAGNKMSAKNKGYTKKDSTGNMIQSTNVKGLVDSKFKNQIKLVFDKYFLLKDALVSDENYNAKRFSKELLYRLAKVDMNLLTDKYHNKWLELNRNIKKSANSIVDANEIAVQRNLFIYLSDDLIKTIKLFEVNQKVYVQFCPMANNNKGANWLSLEEEIKNPYFGNSMLNCGSIIN